MLGAMGNRVRVASLQYFIRPVSSRFVRCRYRPSCSQYSVQAVEMYGFPTGIWLTTKRLLRCVPWVPFGTYDPVPPPARGQFSLAHRGPAEKLPP